MVKKIQKESKKVCDRVINDAIVDDGEENSEPLLLREEHLKLKYVFRYSKKMWSR